MSKISMYTETKKALFVNNERVTEYIFDEILQTENEFILHSDAIINIYDRVTGEKLFEYVAENELETFRFTTDFFYIEKSDKIWIYTTRGKNFSEIPFDDLYIPDMYRDLRRIIVYRDNKQGVYSFDGEKIIPCEYSEIELRKNGIEAFIKGKDTIVHLYNLNGILIFSAVLYQDYWWTIPAGIVKQSPSGKKGLYSLGGEVILSEIYDEIEISDMYEFNKLDCIKVKRDDKYGVVDFLGKEILPIEFDSIQISEGIPHSSRDFILVKKDDKYGIYSSDGRLQVNIEYKHFKSYFKDETCEACKDGRWGFYIIPKKQFVIADEINITKTGIYEIFVGGKWKELDIKKDIYETKTLERSSSIFSYNKYGFTILDKTTEKELFRWNGDYYCRGSYIKLVRHDEKGKTFYAAISNRGEDLIPFDFKATDLYCLLKSKTAFFVKLDNGKSGCYFTNTKQFIECDSAKKDETRWTGSYELYINQKWQRYALRNGKYVLAKNK